jgi:putative transposase
MARLQHFNSDCSVRFVTFSCYRKIPFLANSDVCRLFISTLDSLRDKWHFKLLGYVLMPDHAHLVILPESETPLGSVIGVLKNRVSIKYKDRDTAMWNKRCFDHNCRDTDSVREKINYCHQNPVKAGLVLLASDWQWSSAGWYEGIHECPIRIDEFES